MVSNQLQHHTSSVERRPRWPGRRAETITLVLILLIAAAFRLYRLDDIPPGFTHDEADHAADAVAILNGARPIYETVGYGREPLYDYAVAALMPIFGQHSLTLRIASVLAGLLLIVVTHLWIRRAFDVPTALMTSALLAVSFWAISTDRQALRSALLPTLFTASIYFLWQALYTSRTASRKLCYALSGLLVGLCLYTYMAARVLPGVFVLLWFYLLIFHRRAWKQNWISVIGSVMLGVALSLPMFAYLVSNPGSEARLAQLGGPIDRLFAGDPSEVLSNAIGALGMFTFKGDNLWLYNIPDRPILDWVTGALFYLGVVLACLRFRRIEYALALFWLLVGVFPSLLTGVVASSLRSIAAQPVVYLFAAVGAVEVARWFKRLIQSRVLRAVVLVAWIVVIAIGTAHDYFDVWGQARDVRVAYHSTLFEMARYLDREAAPSPVVAISSIYPNRFHDPYSMAMMLRRRDVSLRWFTASFVDMTGAPHASLIFPDGAAQVITQTIAPIDPVFAGVFNRHAERIDSIQLRADDFSPRFDVYRFDGEGALADALASAVAPAQTLDFGHALTLIGYDVRTDANVECRMQNAEGRMQNVECRMVRPGEAVSVVTYWRILSPLEREVVLFTHALTGDPDRPVLAQQDLLDVPAYYWIPGDAFAQVHRFVIPVEAAPGVYPLEVGAYTRDDGVRLPLYDLGGTVIGDHALIGAIEIAAR